MALTQDRCLVLWCHGGQVICWVTGTTLTERGVLVRIQVTVVECKDCSWFLHTLCLQAQYAPCALVIRKNLHLPQPACTRQKAWDTPIVNAAYDQLLESAPDDMSWAHLLATHTHEFGAWFNALPVSALGLRMDDGTIRVALFVPYEDPRGRNIVHCNYCTCLAT